MTSAFRVLALLLLSIWQAHGFCFISKTRIDTFSFQLGEGPDILRAPFAIQHDKTFTTDDYECAVISLRESKSEAAVHCCYAGDQELPDDIPWTATDLRNVLKKLYFT